MLSIHTPLSALLYGFGSYLLVTFAFLCIAVGLHEMGHIIFAKYHRLEYRVFLKKGNLTVAADWERLGNRKVYGNMLGIISGLPPIIIGDMLYSTPIFLFFYLIACYDDFAAVAQELSNYKRVFCAG